MSWGVADLNSQNTRLTKLACKNDQRFKAGVAIPGALAGRRRFNCDQVFLKADEKRAETVKVV